MNKSFIVTEKYMFMDIKYHFTSSPFSCEDETKLVILAVICELELSILHHLTLISLKLCMSEEQCLIFDNMKLFILIILNGSYNYNKMKNIMK